ncbi:MAG TPA: DUF4342 domain-containing protein [Gemmatimonadales bacterium]|jgi:hypothetical protein
MNTEEYKVSGEKLVDRVRELVREGNARRIIVKNEAGHTLLEIPLTMGIMGAMFLPIWVALGSIAALASHYTLVVEKKDGSSTPPAGEIGNQS